MTTYLEQELDQMLDEIAILTEGWDEALNMVSKAESNGDKELLFEYLRQFVPRLHQMQRRFNKVKCVDGGWVIQNYTYDIFAWYKKRQIDGIVTPYSITIPPGWLSVKEQDQFNAMRDK